MLRDQLTDLVRAGIQSLIGSGHLPADTPETVEIIDTKQPEHGDFACNYALSAAKGAGMNPRTLAEKLAGTIKDIDSPLLADIEIAGPGFLNFRLNRTAVAAHVLTVLELGEKLRSAGAAPGKKINVEFVSVNPNGPITVGSGRGAAYGDSLCRILEAAGNQVHREYYINDGVNSEQMRLFAESVRHYYAAGTSSESTFPEKGYRGEYVQEVAESLAASEGAGHERDDTSWFQDRSQALMIERQRQDLASFGVRFNTWFSEQSLHDSGVVLESLKALIEKGAATEDAYRTVVKLGRGGVVEEVTRETQLPGEEDEEQIEAAAASAPTLWLRSTKFGDDMDRVLRRRDGRLTYIASDVAYHKDKLTDASGTRGTGAVDKLITVLGPDHHGYIARLQAVLAALLEQAPDTTARPDDGSLTETESLLYESAVEKSACQLALAEAKQKLEVVIFQIVRFVKDGKPAPMRKRDGNIYELRDLISELGSAVAANATKQEQLQVGADVARFFYLMRSHDTHMDFDIDLATKQSDDNPVFYVQYAHARICSVLRKAREAGIDGWESFDSSLLIHERELALIKKILDLPVEVRRAAEDYGVHRIANYSIELARTYHHFYDVCRVVQPDQPDLSRARAALCEAAAIALRSALDILGVSAPEKMERAENSGPS